MPKHIEKFGLGIEKIERKQIDYSQKGLVGLEIKEPVTVKGDAFPKARRIKAKEVEVRTERDAFQNAKNCQVGVVKAERDAFWEAENCQAESVEVGSDAFFRAKNCQVKKVEAEWSAFLYAENCQAESVELKRIQAGAEAFGWAQKCLISEKVKAEGIGKNSRGLVVLGEAEGKIFPSVTLMKGKLERERPEEIRKFFEEELKKSQKGEESIYDYLSFFNWEGKALREGKEKLKRRYEKVKERGGLLEELKDYNFYFLIDDNSEREKIFFGFEKLRKVERQTLLRLNNYFPQLEKIKNYLPVLSLKDWVKLGEYAEFLDFDERKLKEIEKKFEEIDLEEMLKNPENRKFKRLKTAKMIKKLKAKGEEIKKELIEKEFKKEIKDKKTHLVREEILNSPKKNLKDYLLEEKLEKGLDEANPDIVFAVRLHKALEGEGEEKNKKILEQLIKGKKPLDWKENQDWLSKMEKKFDTKKWLNHYSQKYSVSISERYKTSLKKYEEAQKKEIIKSLKDAGIEISPSIEISEVKRIFLENKQKIPRRIQKDINTHFQAINSLKGIERSKLPSKIILETEENPLKILQMGERVIGSCLRIRGGYEESAVCNAADINKKVIWAKDEKGNILGRVLIGITEEGKLAGFSIYTNDPRVDLETCFKNFLSSLAKELKSELTSKGEIKQLVGENWYRDEIKKWKE